jgi:hypothetical protein
MKKLILICTVLGSVALSGCVYRPYGYRDGYYRNYQGNYYSDRSYRDDGYYGDRYRYRDRARERDRDRDGDYDRDDR